MRTSQQRFDCRWRESVHRLRDEDDAGGFGVLSRENTSYGAVHILPRPADRARYPGQAKSSRIVGGGQQQKRHFKYPRIISAMISP